MARRILVAVDNPIQAEHVRLLVEGAGYLVHTAANGREGLQSAQSAPPDLIISDVGLPEVDGYAFCRAVKSAEATGPDGAPAHSHCGRRLPEPRAGRRPAEGEGCTCH